MRIDFSSPRMTDHMIEEFRRSGDSFQVKIHVDKSICYCNATVTNRVVLSKPQIYKYKMSQDLSE